VIEVKDPVARQSLERWTALALLLPSVFMADIGPTSILAGDFLPHATGAGLAALTSIPLAILLLFRRGTALSAGLLILGLLVPAILALGILGTPTDSFESRRTLLSQGTAFALLLGGASLDRSGTRTYVRGITLVSIAFLVGAFADRQPGLGGALGNTGSIAMAALPGAVAGAACLRIERGPWRVVGGLALGLFLAFVARVPVIAGGLAAGAGLCALAWGCRGAARFSMLGLAALAGACALAPILLRAAPPEGSSAARLAGDTGGFPVRARVWSSSFEMLADHPLLGVGPGQFAAAFPPYRDPIEIGISRSSTGASIETEVEHPHSDWLLPALELGAPLGLLWMAFLLLVARGAMDAIHSDDVHRGALAAASVAVLAYALVHAPLTHEPAAAAIAFAAFGAVLPRGPRFRPWPVLLLLLAIPVSVAYVRHGRALGTLARDGERDAGSVSRSIERALDACPDSPLARSLRARSLEQRQIDPVVVADAWSRVLELRPFRVEALMQIALARLKSGDPAGAREAYERARSLDPGHPGIEKNLRLLDLQEGALVGVREWLDGADPPAEGCYARSQEERAGGDALLADLLEARAHLLWARGHAENGRFSDAVRSYRQCLRVTGDHISGGAPRVRLELAAALGADGREDEARSEIARVRPSDADRAALPAWASEWCRRLRLGG